MEYEIEPVTVTSFYTTNAYCYCPECGERVEGWRADPSGSITTCDHCECYK